MKLAVRIRIEIAAKVLAAADPGSTIVRATLNRIARTAWNLLLVAAIFGLLAVLVLPAIATSRSTANRTQSLNNLRNTAISIHAFATSHNGSIPAGGTVADESPLKSWMVQTLPYLECSSRYDRIHFDEPWNSAANQKSGSECLPVFLVPGDSIPGPVDGYGIAHQAGNSRLFGASEGIDLDDVSKADGLTATILLGEIGGSYPPWIRPGNVRDPANGLGLRPDQFGRPDRGCNFVFADGSGRYLSPNTAQRVMELLADPNNGAPRDDEF